MQTPASATEKSQAPTQAGNQHLESSFAERTWGLQPTSWPKSSKAPLCPVWGSPVQEGQVHAGLGEKKNTVGWNSSHFPYPNSQCGIQVLTVILCEAYPVLFKGGLLVVRVGAFLRKPSDLHALIYLEEVILLETTFIINVPARADVQNFLPSSLFCVLHFCQFTACWPSIYCHRIFLQF